MSERGGPTLIQSVQRATHLLGAVAERAGRATAKELARDTALSPATTYHLLRTLVHEGYLQRLDDGSYVLGHTIDTLRSKGAAARSMAHARPALQWLRDELGSPVYLARHVDGEIAIVEIVDSPKIPRIDLWVGIHDAAHASALGKSILGQLLPAEQAEYLARHPLHDLTPRTVVDSRRLCDRLPGPDAVAVDDGEYALGVRCLAAPIVIGGGVGAVGVVASPRALRESPHASETLRTAANRVTRAFALA